MRAASSAPSPSVEPMNTVPSSSMLMSAPVIAMISLIFLPLGPITSPILSTGIWIVMIRGAKVLTSPRGSGIVASITSRICIRASLACCSALASTSAGMPWTFMSSWIAVTNSSRAGDLEVHVAERVLRAEDVGQGHVLPVVGDHAHRDAGNRRLDRHTGVHHRQGRPQTLAIDVEPLELMTSDTRRRA